MGAGDDSMAVTLRCRRFTLDDDHQMGEIGILGEGDRVELVEGETTGAMHGAIRWD